MMKIEIGWTDNNSCWMFFLKCVHCSFWLLSNLQNHLYSGYYPKIMLPYACTTHPNVCVSNNSTCCGSSAIVLCFCNKSPSIGILNTVENNALCDALVIPFAIIKSLYHFSSFQNRIATISCSKMDPNQLARDQEFRQKKAHLVSIK